MIPLDKSHKVLEDEESRKLFIGNSPSDIGKPIIEFNGRSCIVLFEGSLNVARKFIKQARKNQLKLEDGTRYN